MKYYIATKLHNTANHNIVRDALNRIGHTITYDWTVHGPVFDKGVDEIKRVNELEIKGVRDADVLIVLPNCETNNIPTGRGTHVELGLAIAWEKCIYMVGNKDIIKGSHKETTCFWYNDLIRHAEDHFDLIIQISKDHSYILKDNEWPSKTK